MKRLTLVLVLVAAVVVVIGCGESAEDKAKNQVCDAKSDIQKQVNDLKNLSPDTATTNGIKDNLNSIKDDLNKIADAQGDLNAERQKQVKAANDKFVSEFQSVASNLGTNVSLSDARAQLTAAAQQLATAYQNSFAQVDCS